MESGRGSLRAVVAVVACCVALAACAEPGTVETDAVPTPTTVPVAVASEPGFAVPDLTTRSITMDSLPAMLPAAAGPPTLRTNESLVLESSLDREDQSRDIVAAARVGGIAAEYETDTGEGHVWIDVLADAETAHTYLVDLAGDIAKGIDGTHHPSALLSDPSEFAVTSGEEAIGMVGSRSDSETETLILGRVGRIVYFVSEVRTTTADARVAVQYLADDTLRGILEALAGEPVDPASPTPVAYRFQTTIDVTGENDRWTTTATGTTDSDRVSCRLDRTTPTGSTSLDIVALGDAIWSKAPDAAAFGAPGPDVVAAGGLTWCPSWPLSARAVGLPVGATGPRHNVNGTDATEHTGDAALLAELGVADPLLAIDTFSYWIADDTDSMVELSMLLTAPAVVVLPLIGTEFADAGTVTVSIRHRVFDLGSIDPIIAPN